MQTQRNRSCSAGTAATAPLSGWRELPGAQEPKKAEAMKYSLYAGEVELEFDEKKHVYSVDGANVPSVTGITKIIDKSGPLMWWAIGEALSYVEDNLPDFEEMDEIQTKEFFHEAHRAHLKTSRKATSIGHLVHDWINEYVTCTRDDLEPEPPKNKEARRSIYSFLDWYKENVEEAIDSEFKVYSREHGYAGTADLDALVIHEGETERALIDWKTSKAIYPEYEIQAAAYVMAREEELCVSYDAIYIICLPKDGGDIQIKRYPVTQAAQDAFLGALTLQTYLKKKD